MALAVSVLVDSVGKDDGPSAASPDTSDEKSGDDGGSDGDEPEEPKGEFFSTDYEGLADPAASRSPTRTPRSKGC